MSEAARADLLEDMKAKGIDVGLTLSILDRFNSGDSGRDPRVTVSGVPSIDGVRVIDLRRSVVGGAFGYAVSRERAEERLDSLGIDVDLNGLPETRQAGGRFVRFDRAFLEDLGYELIFSTGYGVLNGGSATSYADKKKNSSYGSAVASVIEPLFNSIAPLCADLPKGMTPAYLNADGSPGASFLELKMRARLLLVRESRRRRAHQSRRMLPRNAPHAAESNPDPLPLFQMASTGNASLLSDFYRSLSDSPLLAPLAQELRIRACNWRTGIQPLIAAYTHSTEGLPKRIYDRAHGECDSTLPLPGGHGQCFRALAEAFKDMRSRGTRFVCIGNVDNLGYAPDPVELAILALSDAPAAFDFSFRTAMDTKGGILVETREGKRTVADIGPALSREELERLEKAGSPILFNCASGIFDLDWLLPKIDWVSSNLPLRFSDQDKDAGRYSQAEQLAWEITSLMDGFIAFAVDKPRRFIAAKLLSDTILTSAPDAVLQALPEEIRTTASALRAGLHDLLTDIYGLQPLRGKWQPSGKLQPNSSI